MNLGKWTGILALLLSFTPAAWSQDVPGDLKEVGGKITNTLMQEEKKLTVLEEHENIKIQYYKPIYFAYGEPSSKLQFSFRIPLFENFPLNFAYTQIIFWELTEDSKPFLDATYNPDIFYRFGMGEGLLRSIDWGIWEHNSNGKAGTESRSYDQTYARLNYALESKSWLTQFSAKARYLFNDDEENADIYDYVGLFEFEIKFLQLYDSWLDRFEAALTLKPGGKYGMDWGNGGYKASFNFHLGGLKVVPAFYIEYYHGYAETLINYNEKVDEVRAGLMF
jgi:phospholipase A1